MSGSKKLNFWDLMNISVGQIIGSGIVILTGIAIGMTGRGVAISFIIAAILCIIPVIALAALGSAIPSGGGQYTYVRDLLGKKTGFFYIALMVAGQLVLANYAIGFAEYFFEFFPSIPKQLVSGIVMTLIFLANLRGLKTAVIVQKILVVLLIGGLFAFIGFGLPQVTDFSTFFKPAVVMPNGITSFVAAVFLLRFALIGAEWLSEYGGQSENPGRDIPRAMISSLLVVAALYFLIGVVAAGVLPVDQVAFKTLSDVAREIFPNIVYVFFIVGGCMFALVSSLNAVFSWCTFGIGFAIEDGWLPKGLAVRNEKYGTQHILLAIFYVLGMLPIVMGGTIEIIALLGNNLGLIFSIFPVLALTQLAKKRPEAYEKAYFKLPQWLNYALPILCIFIYGYGFYSSAAFIGAKGIIAMGVYSLLVCVYGFIREKWMIKNKVGLYSEL